MPGIPINEILRLYQTLGLSATDVASELGVTRQAISFRLNQAGVATRQNQRKAPAFDREILIELYVNQKLSVDEVARKLRSKPAIVARSMDCHGIERRRPGGGLRIKYPEIRNLRIGDSVDLPQPISSCRKPHPYFHAIAKNAGIQVSVRLIGDNMFRITRRS